jgi:hypothetical protein
VVVISVQKNTEVPNGEGKGGSQDDEYTWNAIGRLEHLVGRIHCSVLPEIAIKEQIGERTNNRVVPLSWGQVSAQEPRLARRDSSPLKPEMSWKEP